MMIMPTNWAALIVGYWAGKYPGSIGHLYSPGGFRTPVPWLPYALDNGAWGAHLNNKEWDAALWRDHLRRGALAGQAPLWAVVPDVVGNREATLELWNDYAPEITRYGWPLAFAAQDGMTFKDVPKSAAVIFLGGSTEWKLASVGPWCAQYPGRVHVARVNTYKRLRICQSAGAISCDGTGWGRARGAQYSDLNRYIEEEWNHDHETMGAPGV